MLAAQDREQVLDWSDRQLGPRPGLVSVFESDPAGTGGTIEKDGTGIDFERPEGCRPVMSIMANLMESVLNAETDASISESTGPDRTTARARPSIH